MAAILDLFGAHLDNQRRVLGGLYHCAKFDYNRCSSFDNMNVSIFGTFCWKTPIYVPKIKVLGLLDPLSRLSGVTRLQWARVQVFQKGPLFPQKKLLKNSVGQILGPQQRWARVHCTPCTPYCYATE